MISAWIRIGNYLSCLQSLRGIITQLVEEFNIRKVAVLFKAVSRDSLRIKKPHSIVRLLY